MVYAFNAGQVVTFSNFGGATGSPQCNIYMLRYLLGGARNLIRPAVRRLDMLPMDSQLQSGGGGDVPIRDLTVGYKAVHYLIKTGTLAAGLSAGARAYGSLSDTIITRPKIKVDNVVKRDCGPSDPYVMKSYVAFQLESVNPEIGYKLRPRNGLIGTAAAAAPGCASPPVPKKGGTRQDIAKHARAPRSSGAERARASSPLLLTPEPPPSAPSPPVDPRDDWTAAEKLIAKWKAAGGIV